MLKRGFTLIELTVVIIILGILAVIAIPQFTAIKNDSLDREAMSNLKLIQAAEKARFLIEGGYIAASDTAEVNNELRLAIPTNPSSLWEYEVVNVVADSGFTAKARRTTFSSGDPSRVMWINESSEDAALGGTW